jgi:transcriptional regulator with XRE-family HTH domain
LKLVLAVTDRSLSPSELECSYRKGLRLQTPDLGDLVAAWTDEDRPKHGGVKFDHLGKLIIIKYLVVDNNYIICNNTFVVGGRVVNMSGETFHAARKQRGWTQAEAGAQLGVSQAYVALLEKGHRRIPPKLARKAVRLFRLPAELLPLSGKALSAVTPDELARDLGRLGYPGFAYMKGGWLKNPGDVLLAALARPQLDSRVTEALPWLLLQYPELDSNWLVTQARLLNVTNRLGFLVDLARRVSERNGETKTSRYRALSKLADSLRVGRLEAEDTLAQDSLTEAERAWLRVNRSADAHAWHVLTDWRPELLQYSK